jgi:hypothetical protein
MTMFLFCYFFVLIPMEADNIDDVLCRPSDERC